MEGRRRRERTVSGLDDVFGGLASDNPQILVEYLVDCTEYLVLTAYPEYEDFDGNELSPSDWQVVSYDSNVKAAS